MNPHEELRDIAHRVEARADHAGAPVWLRKLIRTARQGLESKQTFVLTINHKSLCHAGRILQHAVGLIDEWFPKASWADDVEGALDRVLDKIGCEE